MDPPEARRVASLVPGATETLFVLGAWDRLVAVSHECDFPPAARDLPQATRTNLPEGGSQKEIDAAVRDALRQGRPLHEVDVDVLRRAKPDLVIAQTSCDVCGITPRDAEPILAQLKPRPEVHPWHVHSWGDVLDQTHQLGKRLGLQQEARSEIFKQWSLAKQVRTAVRDQPKVRTAVLDWVDPPMAAGHWTHEFADLAAGEYTLVGPGQPSRWTSWDELEEADPEVIVVAACGRPVEPTADEFARAIRENDLFDLSAVRGGRLWVADGNRFFNRPGPRLIYSAALLARALHPDHVPALPASIEDGLARLEVPRHA